MIRIAQTFLIIGVICLIAGTHYGSPVEGDTSDAALVLQFIGGFMTMTGLIQLMSIYWKLQSRYNRHYDLDLLSIK